MMIGDVLNRLQKVKTQADKSYMACCPAHDDRKQSLHISLKDQTIVLNCFAGCQPENVVKAMGLEMADLFHKADPVRRAALAGKESPSRIVCTYDYTDQAGQLLYQVVRYDPKSFRQRHQNGAGEWTWNMDGVTRVLYHLPEVLAAETVYLVEGEKDADNLKLQGVTATTSPGGANAWKPEYADYLTGKRVVIIPDKDPPGMAYARQVAGSLAGKAREVKTIILPGEAKDTSDWLAAGGKAAELPGLERPVETLNTGKIEDGRLHPEVDVAPRSITLNYSGIKIKVACLEEYNHGIHGEVSCNIGGYTLLQYESVNFSSSANVDKVAARLSKTCARREIGEGAPWDDIWEDVRVRTIDHFRRGETVESVWTNCDEVKRPEYLIWPYIPMGQTTIFFAEPETFKTGFGLLFAGIVGACWDKHPPLGIKLNLPRFGGSVLYLDNETRYSDALWQMKRLAAGFDVDFPLNYRRLRRPLADEVEQVKEWCIELQTNFIVIDSLMRAAGGDIIKTESVNRLFDAIDYLGQTTLILAHNAKNAEGQKSIYGNAFFQYLPRSVWELKKVKETDSDTLDIGFFHVKGNLSKKFPPRGYHLTFEENGPIKIETIDIQKTELAQYTDASSRILYLLKDGKPRTYQGIAEEIGVKEGTVQNKLSWLNRQGKVQNLGAGWTLRGND